MEGATRGEQETRLNGEELWTELHKGLEESRVCYEELHLRFENEKGFVLGAVALNAGAYLAPAISVLLLANA